MKQFRETKEAKLLAETLVANITFGDVIGDIHNDDAVNVIKIIDESAEDWDVTHEAFQYFLKQLMTGISEGIFEEDEWITDDFKRLMKLAELKLSKS